MKKYQGFKGFIFGFLAAVILLISIPALATSIDVIFNPLNIAINGELKAQKNTNYTLSNGDEVPFSIVYKGTTYLPLRKVAELFGKDVVLDSTTDTVHINDPVVIYNPQEEFPETFPEKEVEEMSEPIAPTVKRYTDEKGLNVLEVNGEKYLPTTVVNEQQKFLSLDSDISGEKLILMDFSLPGELNVTSETQAEWPKDIPWYDPLDEGEQYIKYDYYINVLLPFIQKLSK